LNLAWREQEIAGLVGSVRLNADANEVAASVPFYRDMTDRLSFSHGLRILVHSGHSIQLVLIALCLRL
jgi:hypothetical protein